MNLYMAEKIVDGAVDEEASGITRWMTTYWEASSSVLSATVGEAYRWLSLPGLCEIVSQKPGTREVLYKSEPSAVGADVGSRGSRAVVSEKTMPSSVWTLKCDCAEVSALERRVIVGSMSRRWRGR